MNQRARHVSVSFTIQRLRESTVPLWICEQETWKKTEYRRIERHMWEEEEETNREKSEREKRPPSAEIAVSVLAFISASIVGDAILKVSALSRVWWKQTAKEDRDEDSRARSSRINPNRQLFNRLNLPICRTRTIAKEKKKEEEELNLWRSIGMDPNSAANSREAVIRA